MCLAVSGLHVGAGFADMTVPLYVYAYAPAEERLSSGLPQLLFIC